MEEAIYLQENEELKESKVINLLQEHFKQRYGLIQQFTDSAAEIESTPVQHLLNMIKIDLLMHMDICLLAIAIIQGELLAEPEKEAFNLALKTYRELEKSSKNRARTISKNVWVKQNKGLKKLIKLVKDGEKCNKKFIRRAFNKLIGRKDIQPLNMRPLNLDTLVRNISVMLEELGHPN